MKDSQGAASRCTRLFEPRYAILGAEPSPRIAMSSGEASAGEPCLSALRVEVMTGEIAPDTILSVRDLKTWFVTRRVTAKAVDGVTFDLKRGETLAVVGESGSGKSVTSLSIMGLLSQPGAHRRRQHPVPRPQGAGRTTWQPSAPKEFRKIRGREIAMIFQEPMTSLNPLYTVGDQIGEMIALHEPVSRQRGAQPRA